MKRFLLLLVPVVLISCATAAGPEKIKADEAAAWIANTQDVQVVDVRRPDEYAGGHLKGATLVTWGQADFEKLALAKLAKDQPVLVYCRSGRRSAAAVEAMSKLGFKSLKSLEGGISAWESAGNPVVDGN